jgi:hypothetical protein
MAKLTESQLYGPIGKAGWDYVEAEIDRQCAEAGMTPLEKYSAAFTLNLNTGEIKLVPPPKGGQS